MTSELVGLMEPGSQAKREAINKHPHGHMTSLTATEKKKAGKEERKSGQGQPPRR